MKITPDSAQKAARKLSRHGEDHQAALILCYQLHLQRRDLTPDNLSEAFTSIDRYVDIDCASFYLNQFLEMGWLAQ